MRCCSCKGDFSEQFSERQIRFSKDGLDSVVDVKAVWAENFVILGPKFCRLDAKILRSEDEIWEKSEQIFWAVASKSEGLKKVEAKMCRFSWRILTKFVDFFDENADFRCDL